MDHPQRSKRILAEAAVHASVEQARSAVSLILDYKQAPACFIGACCRQVLATNILCLTTDKKRVALSAITATV